VNVSTGGFSGVTTSSIATAPTKLVLWINGWNRATEIGNVLLNGRANMGWHESVCSSFVEKSTGHFSRNPGVHKFLDLELRHSSSVNANVTSRVLVKDSNWRNRRATAFAILIRMVKENSTHRVGY
jgi:hypothetical protein